MKKFIKLICILLTLCMVTAVFVSCNDDKPAASTPNTPNNNGGENGGNNNGGENNGGGNNGGENGNGNGTENDGIKFESVDEIVYISDEVEALNLRTSPSSETDENIAKPVAAGTELRRIGYNESWSKVMFEGEEYYCSTKYLTTEKPDNTPDDPEIVFENVNEELYVDTTEYDKANASYYNAPVRGETHYAGGLAHGTLVKRTGVYYEDPEDEEKLGWSRIEIDGDEYYIRNSVLSATDPNANGGNEGGNEGGTATVAEGEWIMDMVHSNGFVFSKLEYNEDGTVKYRNDYQAYPYYQPGMLQFDKAGYTEYIYEDGKLVSSVTYISAEASYSVYDYYNCGAQGFVVEYTTEYTYEDGKLVRADHFKNGTPTSQYDLYEYGEDGKLKTVSYYEFDYKVMSVEYDASGKAVKCYDDDEVTELEYDSNGRLVKMGGDMEDGYLGYEFTYGEDGQLAGIVIEMTDGNGSKNEMSYELEFDAEGRILTLSSDYTMQGVALHTVSEYVYDNLGRVDLCNVTMTTNGQTVIYENDFEYNNHGKLSEVAIELFAKVGEQTLSQGSTVTTYIYNADGKLAKLQTKQGEDTYYDELEYDASGKLVKITSFDGEETTVVEYTYHENGNIATMTETLGDNTEPDFVESYYENGLLKKVESAEYYAEYLECEYDYRFQRGYVRSQGEFTQYATYAKEVYEEYTTEYSFEYDDDLLLTETVVITYENGKKTYKEVFEYTWHENRNVKTVKRTAYNYDEHGAEVFADVIINEYDKDGNPVEAAQ